MNKLLSLVSALSLNAWAHEGHGAEGLSHYHATDAWGFVAAAAAAAMLWWFTGRDK